MEKPRQRKTTSLEHEPLVKRWAQHDFEKEGRASAFSSFFSLTIIDPTVDVLDNAARDLCIDSG